MACGARSDDSDNTHPDLADGHHADDAYRHLTEGPVPDVAKERHGYVANDVRVDVTECSVLHGR